MNKKKPLKVLIAIGAVGVLAIAGYFGYQYSLAPKSQPVTNQPTQKPTNWPEYKSDKFSFSIKYPEGWQIKDSEDSVVLYKDRSKDPESSENSTIKFVKGEFGHGLMGIDREEKKEIDIFRVKGIRENFYSGNKLVLVIITFKKGEDFSFEFRPSETEPEKDITSFEDFLQQNK